MSLHAPSLRRNAAWALAGNGIYATCQWAMLVVLAKLGSRDQVGQFALALAITTPVFQLAGLNLRAIQATDARREFRPGDVLALRLAMLAAAGIVVTAITTVARVSRETTLVIAAVGLAKTFESCSDVLSGMLQQRERMAAVSRSQTLRGVTGVLGLSLGMVATGRVPWGCFVLALAWGGVLVLHDLPCALGLLRAEGGSRRDLAPGSTEPILRLAQLAAPLGLVMMLIALNTAIPRYVLAHSAGEGAVGAFSALASLIVTGTLVVGAVGATVSPRLARMYAEHDLDGFRGLVVRLAVGGGAIGIVGVLVAAVAGSPILRFLYTAEYAAYAGDLVWVMLAGALAYVSSFLGYGLTAARVLRPQVGLLAAVALASTVTSMALVPHHGVRGAAWALCAAYAVQLIGSVRLCVASWHRFRVVDATAPGTRAPTR